MHLLSTGISASLALVLLSGCVENASSPSSTMPSAVGLAVLRGNAVSVIPKKYLPIRIKPMRGRAAPDFAKRGIYVSALSDTHLYGFPKNNSGNAPPLCSIPATGVQGFGVDNAGNLIIPEGNDGITVWDGPAMCGIGPPGTITDAFGQATDASAVNALTGNIAVANFVDTGSTPGSISICTLSSGTCATNLTNPNLFRAVGVAMNGAGDCWADGSDASDAAVLVYFAGCTGSGQLATGFRNGFYGGVDVDSQGNLVTISGGLPSRVNVYSGCNPACKRLSTTVLAGLSMYGHVGKQNARYVTTDIEIDTVEVYRYKKTGLSLLYSFTGGLPCATDLCEAAAYNPSSPK
ncbi:MAG: hypothetical protein WA431_05675 [Candidatus Cybelea sp.]